MAEHIERSNNLVKADKGWEQFKSSWPNKEPEKTEEPITKEEDKAEREK